MRALSIQEPYASLIGNGYKKVETRSWYTSYRGLVLIHASKKDYPGWKSDSRVNWMTDTNNGKAIAIANLIDCIPTEDIEVSEEEKALGFYGAGRYGWVFDEVKPIEKFDMVGKLGLFSFEF